MPRSGLGFLATLALLAALVLVAAFATVLARSVVPSPFSGIVGGVVFGLLLYAVTKAAARKFAA